MLPNDTHLTSDDDEEFSAREAMACTAIALAVALAITLDDGATQPDDLAKIKAKQ